MRKNYHQLMLLCMLFFSYSYIAQQQYTNFDNELSVAALITQYPNGSNCTGAIEISCLDGTGPYLYSIDAGNSFDSSPIITGQCEGKLFVHVRDANGKLGLTFIDLTPPAAEVEPFTLAEKQAIKANIVQDLNTEKANYLEGSFEYRKVNWKLSRLGEELNVNIGLINSDGLTSTYEVPVLIPPIETEAQYESELVRLNEIFNSYNLNVTMNYSTWMMTLEINNSTNNEYLEEVIKHLGFYAFTITI